MSAYLNALREEGTRGDLLAEVERLKHDIDRHLTVCTEQAAEIERLREALRDVPCPADADSTVGLCVERKVCGCTFGTAFEPTRER